MEKVFIRKNENAKLGYELVIIDDFNNEIIKEISSTDPKNPEILKLPENPSNRKWFSINKIKENQIELSYKESKVFGPRNEKSEKSEKSNNLENMIEYLNDEEKILFLELLEKAKKEKKRQELLKIIEDTQKLIDELTF